MFKTRTNLRQDEDESFENDKPRLSSRKSVTVSSSLFRDIWHISLKSMPYISRMCGIDLKDFVQKATNFAMEKLLDVQIEIEKDKDDWSVYILNTNTHIAVVAAKESLGYLLPEDGSFINGVMVKEKLTESSAKCLVEELKGKISS